MLISEFQEAVIRLLSRVGIVVVLFLGAVVLLNRPKTTPPPKATPAADSAVPGGASVPSARAVAENFARATTQSERLKWVRQADKVATAMEEFFTNGSGSREQVAEIMVLPPVVSDGLPNECFGAKMSSGDLRLLCVVGEGVEAKVDFKAYARLGSQPWPAILKGEAREAKEMRVFIRAGEYYNFGFLDDKRWQNFSATSPDFEVPVQFFYIDRSDPAMKRLEALDPHNPVRVTVDIRAVGDSHLQRQFEITGFHGTGWVLPE
jgi:hypothetical protein